MKDRKDRFHEYLSRQGLKSTRQREIVLDAFLRCDSHPSTEELYLRLRRQHPGIGYATVHRCLKLFSDCGIAEAHDFGDGQTRYESTSCVEHHDHLICKDCGVIIEFEDPRIEQLQQEVAQAHGFAIVSHRLELFGRCADCQSRCE
jgi:Fur family transcriptional regulator, ferric uptake regulator